MAGASIVTHLLLLRVGRLTLQVGTVIAAGDRRLPLEVLRSAVTATVLPGKVGSTLASHVTLFRSKGMLRHGGHTTHVEGRVWALRVVVHHAGAGVTEGGRRVSHVALDHSRGTRVRVVVPSSEARTRTRTCTCTCTSASRAISTAVTGVEHGGIIVKEDSRATELLSIEDVLLLLALAEAALIKGRPVNTVAGNSRDVSTYNQESNHDDQSTDTSQAAEDDANNGTSVARCAGDLSRLAGRGACASVAFRRGRT